MSLQRLEGMAVKIDAVADHTFVFCPDNGQYFVCWGGHSGPDRRTICSGNGRYDVANCYRGPPILGHKDTAEIGAYGVDGVCHQSANCFLYSTKPTTTLTLKVRGYWFSVGTYGVYGNLFLPWLAGVYHRCRSKAGAETEPSGPLTLPARILGLHQRMAKEAAPAPVNPADVIVQETALVAEDGLPGVKIDGIAAVQRDYLKEKDGLIASGLKGAALAARINDVSSLFQRAVAQVLGPETFTALTGMEAGETVAIVDPAIAAAAGVSG